MDFKKILKSSHFELSINNHKSNCIILERKKATTKPPFYIFDLSRKCYISSLKPTDKDNVFNFDVRLKGDDFQFYQLKIINSQIHIEPVAC